MQLTKQFYRLLIGIFVTLVFLFLPPIFSLLGEEGQPILSFILEQQDVFLILSISWTMILLIKVLKRFILDQYDMSEEDNLSSRKMHTQIRILERILIFLIILFAVGMILLSFEPIREIGIGLFTSAGLAGIVLGLSAQKVVGALLAGVQIALTQPFRIDDAVVVEGEWGWDLRVHIREKMIAFIQEQYPSALPRTRIALQENKP